MATKIRLRRMGARNKPFYRLVVADSRFATTGRFLEVLGWYDPKQKSDNFSVNIERVNYWLGTGAQLSATAKSLVKKAEAGEGVAIGAAPKAKAPAAPVEVPAAVADKQSAPVEAEAPAAEETPAVETQEA
ncbi:MAG: 30S ribosomal protein S16 [Kiritimatiellales bacterium]